MEGLEELSEERKKNLIDAIDWIAFSYKMTRYEALEYVCKEIGRPEDAPYRARELGIKPDEPEVIIIDK